MVDKYRNIGIEIQTIAQKNSGRDVAEIPVEDRDRIAELVTHNYVRHQPTPYTQSELLTAIRYHSGITPENLPEIPGAGYSPEAALAVGTVDQNGIVNMWLGAAALTARYCAETPELHAHTPVEIFAQALSHELHHKGSSDPNNPRQSGFNDVDFVFDETTTELLRTLHDTRSGLNAFSWYPDITFRTRNLALLMRSHQIPDKKLNTYYHSRDYLGLAIQFAAQRYPQEVQYVQRQLAKYGADYYERDSKELTTVINYGVPLLQQISH